MDFDSDNFGYESYIDRVRRLERELEEREQREKERDEQKATVAALEVVRGLALMQMNVLNESIAEGGILGALFSMAAPELREDAEAVVRFCERMARTGRAVIANG